MSDLPNVLLAAGKISSGFRRDPRFAGLLASGHLPKPPAPPPQPEPDAEEQAFERGFAEGVLQAEQIYAAQAAERQERLAALETAFVLLGEDDAAALREKMRQTVLVLCEATLLPAALDMQMLARRIEKAAAMLVRAADQRRIRINPLDHDLVQGLVPPDLKLEADPAIERGALRIDTDDGGVEDGPATWRASIEQALGEC